MRSLTITLMLNATVALAQADAGPATIEAAPVPEATAAEPTPNALQPDPDKVGFLQGKIDALEEQFLDAKSTLAVLSKIKLSGYVQGRYQYAENSLSGLDATGNPQVKDGFTVRRGRLKVEYQGTVARYMLQTDATPAGVVLKDAEAALTEPWTGKQMFSLTVGQTKWPFGYECVQSSGDREFPERSRVVRAFLNGERDRGGKLEFAYGPVRATFGVFDGNGTQNKGYLGVDNDTEKDFYGRVAVDLKWLTVGMSGAAGKTYRPTDATAPGRHYPRNKIGFDAQVYLDLLPFGSTAIKGEFIAGTTYQSGGVEKFGQTALGWYGLLVQNIGDHEQIAFRYDFFDPATGTPNGVDAADPTRPLSNNQIQTVGFLASHYFDEVLKASIVYEMPLVFPGGEGVTVPRQNLFTLQLQAKF